MNTAIDCGKPEHPQILMAELGIGYNHASVQGCADQWWFLGCENMPEKLPSFLTELKLTQEQAVKYAGLSEEEAAICAL